MTRRRTILHVSGRHSTLVLQMKVVRTSVQRLALLDSVCRDVRSSDECNVAVTGVHLVTDCCTKGSLVAACAAACVTAGRSESN